MPARTRSAHLPHPPMDHARPHAHRSRAVPQHIDHACVAQIGAVFLERQPEDQHPRAVHLKTAFQHGLDQLTGHIRAHPVIDTPPGQDDLRVIAYRLGLVGQVIRVHPDAVPADQPRLERQEIPFRACRFQNLIGVDPHLVEDHRQFVHERNVQVALRVLDYFGGLCTANAFSFVGAGGDDAGIELIDFFCDLGGGARRHLANIGQAVRLSPGLIRSGEYPAKKSTLKVRPDARSRTGTQSSSVAPG